MDLGVVLQTQPARRRAWSTLARQAESSASPMCGRSTPTCCGRSRSSSTARSSPRPRKVDRRSDGHQPGDPRLDRHGLAVRHPERDVRQPHRLRHRPRATPPCASLERRADDPGHAARVDPRHPRARPTVGRSSYKGSTLRFPWAGGSALEVWVAAYGPKALALTGEVGDGFILQLADPDITAWTIAGGARRGRSRPGATPTRSRSAWRRPPTSATTSPTLRDQCRWFGGMVGNHVADIVARYGDDAPGGARGAHGLHRGPAGLRLQRARPGREHPRRLRARRDRSTGSASSARSSAHVDAAARAARRSASTSSPSTSSTTARRRPSRRTASTSSPPCASTSSPSAEPTGPCQPARRRARSTMSSTWCEADAAPGGRGRFSWTSMSHSDESASAAAKSSTRT